MSRQADDGFGPGTSDNGRFAGADGYAVDLELKIGESFKNPEGKVSCPHGTAAGYPHGICRPESIIHHFPEGFEMVSTDAHMDGIGAHIPTECAQCVSIDVPNLPRSRVLGNRHHFITGGQNGHFGPLENRYLGKPETRQDSHVLRPEALSRGKNHRAPLKIVPGLDGVL